MVPMVREVREKLEDQKKSGNLTFQSRENLRVRESQGKSKYQGAKVNKNTEKKIWLHTIDQIFFCSLRSQIISMSTFEFVPPLLFLV